jgi:hypothetical protein
VRDDADAELADLALHWAELYQFACNGEVWSVSPISDPGEVLVADSAACLREMVRKYYASHAELHRRPRDHDQAGTCWCGAVHYTEPTDT